MRRSEGAEENVYNESITAKSSVSYQVQLLKLTKQPLALHGQRVHALKKINIV